MQSDVIQSVGSSSDYILSLGQYFPGFCDRHVRESQMYPVGSALAYQLHAVIENEDRSILPAQLEDLGGSGTYLVRGCMFHPELDPAASSLEGYPYGVQICYVLCKMGYELYLKHSALFLCRQIYL